MKKHTPPLLVLLALLAMPGMAAAAPITFSNVAGSWQNADPAANATYANVAGSGADFVHWGGTGNNATDSGYTFDPVDGTITPVLDQLFALGTFTHQNQPIPSGSSITSIDYAFSLSTNGVPNSLFDVFSFTHDETPNSTPCAYPSTTPCADRVTVGSVNLNSLILVGPDQYYFNLFGFSTDGGLTTSASFISQEGGNNSAVLYGKVTSQPIINPLSSVPEPGSMLLLGSGLLGVARYAKKRKFVA
jgi:hypothetical protein